MLRHAPPPRRAEARPSRAEAARVGARLREPAARRARARADRRRVGAELRGEDPRPARAHLRVRRSRTRAAAGSSGPRCSSRSTARASRPAPSSTSRSASTTRPRSTRTSATRCSQSATTSTGRPEIGGLVVHPPHRGSAGAPRQAALVRPLPLPRDVPRPLPREGPRRAHAAPARRAGRACSGRRAGSASPPRLPGGRQALARGTRSSSSSSSRRGDLRDAPAAARSSGSSARSGRQTRGRPARCSSRHGFRYVDRIDPFDGGPHYEANVAEIPLVRAHRRLRVAGRPAPRTRRRRGPPRRRRPPRWPAAVPRRPDGRPAWRARRLRCPPRALALLGRPSQATACTPSPSRRRGDMARRRVVGIRAPMMQMLTLQGGHARRPQDRVSLRRSGARLGARARRARAVLFAGPLAAAARNLPRGYALGDVAGVRRAGDDASACSRSSRRCRSRRGRARTGSRSRSSTSLGTIALLVDAVVYRLVGFHINGFFFRVARPARRAERDRRPVLAGRAHGGGRGSRSSRARSGCSRGSRGSLGGAPRRVWPIALGLLARRRRGAVHDREPRVVGRPGRLRDRPGDAAPGAGPDERLPRQGSPAATGGRDPGSVLGRGARGRGAAPGRARAVARCTSPARRTSLFVVAESLRARLPRRADDAAALGARARGRGVRPPLRHRDRRRSTASSRCSSGSRRTRRTRCSARGGRRSCSAR